MYGHWQKRWTGRMPVLLSAYPDVKSGTGGTLVRSLAETGTGRMPVLLSGSTDEHRRADLDEVEQRHDVGVAHADAAVAVGGADAVFVGGAVM